ncbi:MAG TPA: NAD(P)/FAD-dependent oxidoreductase [Fimbriimonadaceae bacterium]|nr:NAD(P)/FAD-dependent oxidoreductase [Fimbriimonadaceae bacterium]
MPKVVIVGAGFAGLEAAKVLRNQPVEVTVIDRQNHHCFQPLLYQVATAGLSPANIASPIRRILRKADNVRVVLDEVTGVDTAVKQVVTKEGVYDYDFLILAPGAKTSYFGHDQWKERAGGLKTLADATSVRARILEAFEEAETSPDPAKWLTFVVIGGGATGVEMAGAIAELARRALAKDFRRAHPEKARIVLLEGGPRLIPAFPERLSKACERSLQRLGVEVRLKTFVGSIDEDGVDTEAVRIDAKTIIWAAGVHAAPVAEWLGVEADKQGRVEVKEDLTVPGAPDVFVCGDCARVVEDDKPLPGVCQPAMQEGVFAAKTILARASGAPQPEKFRYKDKGNMATIGRKMAVCQIGRFQFSGAIAWFLWLTIHIWYLIGFRNRLLTIIDWAWAYITFERGARLIVKD